MSILAEWLARHKHAEHNAPTVRTPARGQKAFQNPRTFTSSRLGFQYLTCPPSSVLSRKRPLWLYCIDLMAASCACAPPLRMISYGAARCVKLRKGLEASSQPR